MGAESRSRLILVDAVVVVVGGRVVTRSDIELEKVLIERAPRRDALLVARAADPLERLVDGAVVRGIAGDILLYQPSAAQVKTRLHIFRATWSNPEDYAEFLKIYGVDDRWLTSLMFSQMVVERYISRNLGPPPDAGSEEAADYQAQYLAWITELREQSPIRWVEEPPSSPAPEVEQP